MGDNMKEQTECEECEELKNTSYCCGAGFYEPGWPDNDICSSCGEHSGEAKCEAHQDE